ncbi:hypothetical protein QVD17_32005 [Tagetes erecta]|uniref:Uncharacterized protein n=1 Tax=Tagetes erecta TaxID=13708 RepID=A0AAD8K833_TARER|nr:hypothetical protein QVD17_32005 [Tagetes erecta]
MVIWIMVSEHQARDLAVHRRYSHRRIDFCRISSSRNRSQLSSGLYSHIPIESATTLETYHCREFQHQIIENRNRSLLFIP